MRAVRLPLRFLAATVLLASDAACTHHREIAPSFETITTSTEERADNPPTHVVYVKNSSTVPVVVYRTSLTECANVTDSCTPQSVNVLVAPGENQIVLRIQPADPARNFRYRLAYSWRVDSLLRTAISPLAGSPDVRAEQRQVIQQRGDSVRTAEAAAGYTLLGREDYTPLAGRVAAMRLVGDSIVVAIRQQANIDNLRFVLVDAEGHALGSTLWVRWNAPPGGTVQFLSARQFVGRTPGRTLLTFSLVDEAQRMLGQTVNDVTVPIVVVDSSRAPQ